MKQEFALNVTDPHQQGFFTLQTLAEAGFQKRLHQLGSVVSGLGSFACKLPTLIFE
jgi:hypothetical protein